ncbi:MAG: dihydroorotate dehydrogenase [Actinomycetota bacterium]
MRNPFTRAAAPERAVDMTVSVGSVELDAPLMCASGTAGHGAELAAYFDLADTGAIVVKSLLHEPWAGNPAPRVHSTDAGMINSVGLQGPGVQGWIDHDLQPLVDAGATIVASIWGRSVAEYGTAAELLAPVADRLTALEVNVSCPNVEDRNNMFAHSPTATRDALAATASVGSLPRWAKLSPNIMDLVPIAEAAAEGGAEAVTVANTLIGLAIDPDTRRPRLGKGRGGLSGPAIRPVAVRAVNDVATALPELPVIGCGGVAHGADALEFLLAGACAVQVGTATFADPRAVVRVRDEIEGWCRTNEIAAVRTLTGALEI